MAVPVKFIAKRSLKRIQKGKPVSPFQMFGRKNKRQPVKPLQPIQQQPKQDLKPLLIIGGVLLVAYLLKKK